MGAIDVAFLNALRSTPGTLLDIGAGDGTFIAHAASHGWRCIGVDPAARLDPALVDGGTANFELVAGTVDALDDSQRCDPVTIWDVVEHLDNPEALVRSASRFLKGDGSSLSRPATSRRPSASSRARIGGRTSPTIAGTAVPRISA